MSIASACAVPSKTLKTQRRRGPVWAQPGSNRVFAWSFRAREKESSGTEIRRRGGEDTLGWETSRYTEIDQVRVSAFDPDTGATTTLEESDGDVKPVFWNEHQKTLWVYERNRIIGITTTGKMPLGRGDYVVGAGLPLPFVRSPRTILDLATLREIELDDRAFDGTTTVDGTTMKLTRWREDVTRGTLVVDQTVIDWSGPTPIRTGDVVFHSPPLPLPATPSATSYREAAQVLPDGRRLAEVVTTNSGTQLFVHDLATTRLLANITIGGLKDPSGGIAPTLTALGGDKLVFWSSGADGCGIGWTIAVNTGLAQKIPKSACARMGGTRGRVWLETTRGAAYVDDRGVLKGIGAAINSPILIGPSTIAYKRPAEGGGVDIESFDTATGARAVLGHHAKASDTLLNVLPDRLVFVAAESLIIVPRTGAPKSVQLPWDD